MSNFLSVQCPGLTITKNGVAEAGDTCAEDIFEAVRQLNEITAACQWIIGDLINLNGNKYGCAYEDYTEQYGLSYAYLADIAYIARKWEFSRRRENLSFSHHKVVASLPDEVAEEFLDLAEEQGWSRSQLREEVEAWKASENRLENRLPDDPTEYDDSEEYEEDDDGPYEEYEEDEQPVEVSTSQELQRWQADGLKGLTTLTNRIGSIASVRGQSVYERAEPHIKALRKILEDGQK